MALGAVQAPDTGDVLSQIDKRPGINVTQVNETACLVVLQPTETTITLRDENNRYVRGYNENLYVDSTDINAPEKFRLIDHGDGKVSFIAPNGHYVGFSSGTNVYDGGWYESSYPTALFDNVSESTIFEKISKGDGRYVFKTHDDGYLKVVDD
jgi:hypothetical protein